jgi:Zn-finger nucleic acid-binding protein
VNQHMTCPKCGGAMRSYERNGVTIDQCTECRGVFLDRGELERLVDAEGAFYAGGHAPPPVQRQHEEPHRRRDHDDDDDDDRSRRGYGSGHKRRESFLGDLFG